MKKGFSLLLVLALLCGLTACGEQAVTPATTISDTTATTVVTTVATTTAPTQPAIPAHYVINPLTGERTIDPADGTRPVAVMITNEPGIIGNQYGIDKADFYMETEAEGGVARMMAVFANASRVPEKLGPVRSGRTPFIATANALGAVYVYSGATNYVLNVIKTTPKFNSITNTDNVTLWRDAYLKANANVSWNTLITGGEQLAKKIEQSKFS